MIRGIFTIRDRDQFNALCERICATKLELKHTAQGIRVDGNAYNLQPGIGSNVQQAIAAFLQHNKL